MIAKITGLTGRKSITKSRHTSNFTFFCMPKCKDVSGQKRKRNCNFAENTIVMQIKEAKPSDIPTIQKVAQIAFREAYGSTLSSAQIEYMIELMYSGRSLIKQLTEECHKFLLLIKDCRCIGFVSYQSDYKGTGSTKLHKLYLLPREKGCGYGRILVKEVIERARAHGNKTVTLNMNRNNTAYGFYIRMGFGISHSEDINIGNGYLMEDYVFVLDV